MGCHPAAFPRVSLHRLRFFGLLALTVRILTRRLCRCSEEALPKIAQQGFLRSKQTSAAGAWQRFGERRQAPSFNPLLSDRDRESD